MSASLLFGACDDDADAGVDEFRAASDDASDFAARISDMARAASKSYTPPDNGSTMIVSGLTHRFKTEMSQERMHVFSYEDVQGDSVYDESLIISFRGTEPTSRDDLYADWKGKTEEVESPRNPWTSEGVTGSVGKGFADRVEQLMESDSGEALREYLIGFKARPLHARLDIHVVGHSLGGFSSQLFSLYLYEYLKKEGVDFARVRLYNFAFNSPKGVDSEFARSFADAASSREFTPFSFTMENDPVSSWNASIPQIGMIQQPNSEETNLNGYDIGYCAHLELAANSSHACSLANHELGEPEFLKYESSASDWEGVVDCMKDGYAPRILQ